MELCSPPGTRKTRPSLEGPRVLTENEAPGGPQIAVVLTLQWVPLMGRSCQGPGKCGLGLQVVRALRGSGSAGTPGRDYGGSPLPLTAFSLPCCEPAAGGVPGSCLRMSALVPCK